MQGLKAAGVEVDRKILAELAVSDAGGVHRPGRRRESGVAGRCQRCQRRQRLSGLTTPTSKRPVDALVERNPRVVSAVKLHRGAARRKAGRFLAEGANAVTSAIEAGRVVELFHTVDADPAVLRKASSAGVPVTLVTDKAARALGDTVVSPGIVAVCTTVDVPLARVTDARLVAVPVEIADPGNAGTMIRVADAVGADAVMLAGDSVDPHNGKCVRASAGSVFHLPIVRERDVDRCSTHLIDAGMQMLATAADGEVDLDDADEPPRPARPPGCSATRRTAWTPTSPPAPTTASASRSAAAPRA